MLTAQVVVQLLTLGRLLLVWWGVMTADSPLLTNRKRNDFALLQADFENVTVAV